MGRLEICPNWNRCLSFYIETGRSKQSDAVTGHARPRRPGDKKREPKRHVLLLP